VGAVASGLGLVHAARGRLRKRTLRWRRKRLRRRVRRIERHEARHLARKAARSAQRAEITQSEKSRRAERARTKAERAAEKRLRAERAGKPGVDGHEQTRRPQHEEAETRERESASKPAS
jgi:hypothetical protein